MKLRVIGTGPWASVYRSLLPEPECPDLEFPDAVIIASKASTHWYEAIRWLRWKVPVLVEKPFAMSSAQCEEMIETAEKFGTYLAAAHVLKFDRRIEEFRKHVGKRVNRIVSITWTDPCTSRYDKSISVEVDVLPHIVSIMDTIHPGDDIVCDGISRGGRGRDIRFRVGQETWDVHLERDSDARRRLIETDGATLDFSALPEGHNPLADQIGDFVKHVVLGFHYRSPVMSDNLHTDLALRACRVTEDVLACVERFNPMEAWV